MRRSTQPTSSHRQRWTNSRLSLVLLGFLAVGFADAAVPALDHLFPVALQIGTTGTVAVVGKSDPWPPKLWVDAAGIRLEAGTNTGRLSFAVASEAPPGPHLVRLYNADGASAPRFLIVTPDPQLAEAEPNDDFAKPQPVRSLPASVNGRLEKPGDVDCYAVDLEAGQTVLASLEGYVLGSPMDSVLRLVDAQGRPLALNHDDGRTLDPFLSFTAKADGTYIVQVFAFAYPAISDVRFTGGDKCVYRLHLSRGPWARHTLPLGTTRAGRTALRLIGWNLGKDWEHPFDFDGRALSGEMTQTNWQPPGLDNEVMLQVGDGSERLEQEPNDSLTNASPLELPGAVTGCINEPADVDRFRFSASKEDEVTVQIQSATLGFPVAASLRIENSEGKELKKAEGANGNDPGFDWTAPSNGTFIVAVNSLVHRGGSESFYRLSLRKPLPTVKAVVTESAFTVEAGKTNEIKVAVKFTHGVKGRYSALALGLPDSVQLAPVEVPEKGGQITLKLAAAPEAKPFGGPLRLRLRDSESGQERPVISELVASGADNGVPNGFQRLVIESTDQLWLTVRAAKPAATASAK